jgi:hypothetical protein
MAELEPETLKWRQRQARGKGSAKRLGEQSSTGRIGNAVDPDAEHKKTAAAPGSL